MSTVTQQELDSAIKGYRTRSMKSRERAIAEMRLWDMLGRLGGKRPRRENWMAEVLGTDGTASNVRHTLIRSGEWARPLFDRLDDGLATFTVSRIHSAVLKRERMHGGERETLLKDVLRLHDTLVRTKGPKRSQFTKAIEKWIDGDSVDALLKSARRAPPKPRTPTHSRPAASPRASGATPHRDALLSAVEPHIEPYFDAIGAPEAFRAEVVQGFVVQLTMLLDDFEREAQRASRSPIMTDVSKAEFVAACNVASVTAEWGRALDLPAVERHVAKMKAPFHPDTTGGEWESDSQRHRFEQLTEALEVLKRYQRQVFGKRTAKGG